MILEEKARYKTTCLDIWNRTHTPVGLQVDENGTLQNYTTPAAVKIAVRILIMTIHIFLHPKMIEHFVDTFLD